MRTNASVHIYRAPSQPAHTFVVDIGTRRRRFRLPKRSLVPCLRCRKRRWAQHCVVQVYYDSIRFFCRPGRGCQKARAA